MNPFYEDWQARRDSNPQHPVLETGALPIRATGLYEKLRTLRERSVSYFVSRCTVCVLHVLQNFLNSSRAVVFFLFFVVE